MPPNISPALQINNRFGSQMPLKTDLHSPDGAERNTIPSHTFSPLSHRPGGMYSGALPAVQDSRYNTSSSYENSPSPASSTSVYSHFSYPPPTSYPTSASPYSPSVPGLVSPYSLTPDSARPRIQSMHSPVSHHASNPVPSARSAYSTSTPHTSRHHQRNPAKAPRSPQSPSTSRSMRSPTVASIGTQLEPMSSPSVQTGPPMGNTEILCNLYSADGVLVEPEIHGRVEKGFFLADRDWTCYRRNYFTVVCSYSLKPPTHSFPFYLKRTPTSQPENVLSFAMCISAVIDTPGGKPIDLVQHTPKRDKGPQHKPSKVKLAPQPAPGMGFSPTSHNQHSHSGEFGAYPQQTQLPSVASFERIQFKAATANNGKRRAAQQYYHLIVELWADVGTGNSTSPGSPQSDAGWVRIAFKSSAPMVVRGRSPGHYAEGNKAHSQSGNGGSGTGNSNSQSPTSNGNGNMLGGGEMNTSPDMGSGVNRIGMGNMNGFHNMSALPSNHTSPSAASIRDPSISTPPPIPHMEGLPVDPLITGDDNAPIGNDHYSSHYQYYPDSVYHPELPHPQVYEDLYERKSEGALMTHSLDFDSDISSYNLPHMMGKDQRMGSYRRCTELAETSRGYFPDLPAI